MTCRFAAGKKLRGLPCWLQEKTGQKHLKNPFLQFWMRLRIRSMSYAHSGGQQNEREVMA